MNDSWTLAALTGVGLSLAPMQAATAQVPPATEALVRATAQPATGLALARRQIAAGDLTLAMATLERVILAQPEAGEARLLHAGLLCRLDDRQGSLVELDVLRGRDFPPALWREATEPCEADRVRPRTGE